MFGPQGTKVYNDFAESGMEQIITAYILYYGNFFLNSEHNKNPLVYFKQGNDITNFSWHTDVFKYFATASKAAYIHIYPCLFTIAKY